MNPISMFWYPGSQFILNVQCYWFLDRPEWLKSYLELENIYSLFYSPDNLVEAHTGNYWFLTWSPAVRDFRPGTTLFQLFEYCMIPHGGYWLTTKLRFSESSSSTAWCNQHFRYNHTQFFLVFSVRRLGVYGSVSFLKPTKSVLCKNLAVNYLLYTMLS